MKAALDKHARRRRPPCKQRLFCHVDDSGLSELFQSLLAHFGTETRLLGASKRDVRRQFEMLVYPHSARCDPLPHTIGTRQTGPPHSAAQAILGPVSARDRVIEIG